MECFTMRMPVALVTCLLVFCRPCSDLRAEEGFSPPGGDVLWYRSPAKNWETEALAVGNGRLGGKLFGGETVEHFQFNEDSLWIGDEQDTGAYQAFGDIFVELDVPETSPVESYVRFLDIDRAVHEVRYRCGRTEYRRVAFSSRPDQVVVLRFEADRPGAYSGRVRLQDAHGAATVAEGNRLSCGGTLTGPVYSEGSTPGRAKPYAIALDYEARILVLPQGGQIRPQDGALAFQDCDALTILLAAGTDYNGRREDGWKGAHPRERLESQLAEAAAKPYAALLKSHEEDYQALYRRMSVDWGASRAELRTLPTDQRLAAYRDGAADPDLEELLFQYARYLMISSSRPGCLPANLQGIWNNSNRPPWRSDYHTDVNIEMNYWFVDPAHLSECFEPLADWVDSIRAVRREETGRVFGTRGFAFHAENGIFGGSTWKWSKGDAAWVAQNLWDHYAFTLDESYLRRIYPILKDLCEFWADHLKALPDGTLVCPNGFSPEHGPEEDGVSYEQELVWDLFGHYVQATEILKIDDAFAAEIRARRDRLLLPKVGRWGQLQEWMVDRDDPKDQHRHLSHLVGVYPGNRISPRTTPEAARAAAVSLDARGDEGPGWSRAWKVALWARLGDAERSYRVLQAMIRTCIMPNLFNTHPPFQIDGNFGYAAGVCEMLLQSHLGTVDFLPALPPQWNSGEVRGMRARGGLIVDMRWQDGRIQEAVVQATVGGTFTFRAPPGQTVRGPETVQLRPGETYKIAFGAASP
ncbi:glycoside hydrolase N-terminal domain-containing protein [Thermopirellula anaerolimosa]